MKALRDSPGWAVSLFFCDESVKKGWQCETGNCSIKGCNYVARAWAAEIGRSAGVADARWKGARKCIGTEGITGIGMWKAMNRC